jgi:hypothetical protein
MGIQVISWPQTQFMLPASTLQETFERRITIIYVQVDDQGERVVGGRTVTQTIEGANYDSMLAAMQGSFFQQAVTYAVLNGTFDQSVSVVTLGPSSSVSPSASPSASVSPSESRPRRHRSRRLRVRRGPHRRPSARLSARVVRRARPSARRAA